MIQVKVNNMQQSQVGNETDKHIEDCMTNKKRREILGSLRML